MTLDYIDVKKINGSLIVLDDMENASFEEIVDIHLDDGTMYQGRIVQMDGKHVIIRVFDGIHGISLDNTRTRLRGYPMEIPFSPEILGHVFNGSGWPVDGLDNIFPQKRMNINGTPINPVSHVYPVNYINTGVSSIDMLMILIRGQELPIFSGFDMSHNELAMQIVRQTEITDAEGGNFAIVFAAIGIKSDVAEYLRRSSDESSVLQKIVMLVSLASNPIIEHTLTPRCVLTATEYLVFEPSVRILVIMIDMTSHAEALCEFNSSEGGIPGREGLPGYLYSGFASLYKRTGMVEGRTGSITQIPILTMPNDDVTHPVPDLTGYITGGQIVLDRTLDSMGIYPSVGVPPSLPRLMKDGIGESLTRTDHSTLSNQLFTSCTKVVDTRSLAPVIGEEELSLMDRQYLHFGELFEQQFLIQRHNENRTIDQNLDLGRRLLSTLPRSELDHVDDAALSQFCKPETIAKNSDELNKEADGVTDN